MSFLLVVLLVISAVNFIMMIPGGSVETREFGRYPTWVLVAFNLFLTLLGLANLAVACVMFTQQSGYFWAAIVGMAYLAVFLLDLFEIFPISSDKMPRKLWRMEVLGVVLGAFITVFGVWGWLTFAPQEAAIEISAIGNGFWLFILALVIGIVVFATKSAAKRKNNG